MKTKILAPAVAILTAIALSACTTQAQPPVVVTKTVVSTTTVEPTKTVTTLPDDLQKATLLSVWNKMSDQDHTEICEGWNSATADDRDGIILGFIEQTGNTFDPDNIRAFFEEKC